MWLNTSYKSWLSWSQCQFAAAQTEQSCILVWSDYSRCCPYAPQALWNSNTLIWTKKSPFDFLCACISLHISPSDGRDGANPFPSLHEHLVHINCKTHIRLQSSDSWGKAEKEEWQLSCSKAFIRRWGRGGCLEHTQTSWIHLWGWCNRAHPCASWFA